MSGDQQGVALAGAIGKELMSAGLLKQLSLGAIRKNKHELKRLERHLGADDRAMGSGHRKGTCVQPPSA
eukprot:CAMPEP_0194758080 /NCGR_PEP_ID=MMETSP0323_2-20130528/11431_1 /TAXON_ID=2866 ORGANISM="Crypthecodinium cohnii, Strain Seligo" /NCGR_SAMPLE_ID=MMETSP0323_2 /ASSEMBLY_ACC=CAM_ASM_000346 /LENGTH=68 /DNA_ID=CAMNT_0039678255 /DNA_START=56 /DNA_END=263 /DNA_ORIENTATION=-